MYKSDRTFIDCEINWSRGTNAMVKSPLFLSASLYGHQSVAEQPNM